MSVIDRLRYMRGSALHHAADAVVEAHLRLIRATRGASPLSLGYWRRASRVLSIVTRRGEAAVLQRAPDGPDISLSRLAPAAARALEGSPLGDWAIDAETADWIWRQALREKARFIVECGAGATTLLLSALLRESRGRGASRLASLEESSEEAARVRARLSARGLADEGEIIVAPMTPDGRYAFHAADLSRALGRQAADLIVIDGPATADRTWTLPALCAVARPGTRWMLDDAFTQEYFAVACSWAAWPGLEVDGIVPVGKGLATGHVTNPVAALAELRRRFNNADAAPATT